MSPSRSAARLPTPQRHDAAFHPFAADRHAILRVRGAGHLSLRQVRAHPRPHDDHRPSRGRSEDQPQLLPRRRLELGPLHGPGDQSLLRGATGNDRWGAGPVGASLQRPQARAMVVGRTTWTRPANTPRTMSSCSSGTHRHRFQRNHGARLFRTDPRRRGRRPQSRLLQVVIRRFAATGTRPSCSSISFEHHSSSDTPCAASTLRPPATPNGWPRPIPAGTVLELDMLGPDNAAIVISDVKPQF